MPRPQLRLGTSSAPHCTGAAHSDCRAIAVPASWRVGIGRWSRALGSLPLAVFFLTLFALALALGIYVESSYGPRFAQQVVYEAWWFALLLGILGVNIFCAAAKKWPW